MLAIFQGETSTLNADETECIVIGTRRQHDRIKYVFPLLSQYVTVAFLTFVNFFSYSCFTTYSSAFGDL